MLKKHQVTDLDNFIGGWYLEDLALCDRIIEAHRADPLKHPGEVASGVNADVKKSIDSSLGNNTEIYNQYVLELAKVVNEYVEKYPAINQYVGKWSIIENINIQSYSPGEAFYAYHTERTNAEPVYRDRVLVFLTYLNSVETGGETEFLHQGLKIKPEKGLTLIWSAEWMFVHRGLPSITEHKYIVTGWFNYLENK